MENELLSLIPEYIPLGLGVYDKDGYLKYANGTTLKMFGVTTVSYTHLTLPTN